MHGLWFMRYNGCMKKLKTFWYAFQKSLLDFSYYKSIAKSSFWFSFKYLLFLLICLSLIRSIQLGVLYSFVRKNIPSYIAIGKQELTNIYPKELELRISNGKLYTNVHEPYTIEFPKRFGNVGGKHLVVIDTKGTADNYPQYNTVVLATRQALVFPDKQQQNKTTTQLYYFSDLKRSLYIDHTEYTKMVQSLNPLAAKLPRFIDILVGVGLILLPFVGGFFWTISTLFGLIFLTLIMWLIEKLVKTSFGYKTLYRLGMQGVTWSILFTFLLDFTGQRIANVFGIVFLVWMTLVLIRIKQLKTTA